MPETNESANDIRNLREILWGHIHTLDRVRGFKRRPSVDKYLRVAHGIAQLSGVLLKVIEVETKVVEQSDLEARLDELEAKMKTTRGAKWPISHAG
jgi:hypothetical protein